MVNCVSEMQAENVQDFKLKLFVNNNFSCNGVIVSKIGENYTFYVKEKACGFKTIDYLLIYLTNNQS